MKEKDLIILIEDSNESGFEARALGYSIFTEAEDVEQLRKNIKDAVYCHFNENEIPSVIRLHFVREELMKV